MHLKLNGRVADVMGYLGPHPEAAKSNFTSVAAMILFTAS
jgi:hypothetical protein